MADKTLEQMYIAAYNRIKTAATAADYQEAITLLKKCNGFADSESMIQQCEEALYGLSQEETYQNALSLSEKRDVALLRKAEALFEELGDYKDSRQRLGKVRIKIAKRNGGDPEKIEIVCPKCGHINHGGLHCSKCGAPFQKTEPAGNHRKWNLLILGSIALLALAIGIAVFVHQSDIDEDRNDEYETSIPDGAIEDMDNIAFGRAYVLYEQSLDPSGAFYGDDACWRALHVCFSQEYADLFNAGEAPALRDGYYGVPEERVHEAMFASFGNDDAWGVSSSEYVGSAVGDLCFVVGNGDVSLERLETTVSDDRKTATVEYALKEFEDYDGDGNLEAARFTVEYVPNEYVQVDSEKPLYYMIDDIDFELSEDED